MGDFIDTTNIEGRFEFSEFVRAYGKYLDEQLAVVAQCGWYQARCTAQCLGRALQMPLCDRSEPSSMRFARVPADLMCSRQDYAQTLLLLYSLLLLINYRVRQGPETVISLPCAGAGAGRERLATARPERRGAAEPDAAAAAPAVAPDRLPADGRRRARPRRACAL